MFQKPESSKGLGVTLDAIKQVQLRKANNDESVRRPPVVPKNMLAAAKAMPGVVSLADITNVRLKKSSAAILPGTDAAAAAAAPVMQKQLAPRVQGLRKVEVRRSPGGTPIKAKENRGPLPASYSTHEDFTQALRSKFQNTFGDPPAAGIAPTLSPF